MDTKTKVLIRKETLKKLESKLNVIKITCNDEKIKDKIIEILNLLDEEFVIQIPMVSIEEMIYIKMKETKSSNPELHFNLYKLYRKLSDGKITEEEALREYEAYIG